MVIVGTCRRGHCGDVTGDALMGVGSPEGLQHTGAEEKGYARSSGGLEERKRHGGKAGRKLPHTSHCYIQGLSVVRGKTEVI